MSLHFSQCAAATALWLFSFMVCANDPAIVYYDIVGKNAKELRRELDAKGPLDGNGDRYDGNTKWHVAWSYRYTPMSEGCKISKMDVTLSGVITLPRWTGVDNSSRLSKEWQSYLTSLRLHEDGHYANGMLAAQELDRSGHSLRALHDCASIAGELDAKASEIIEKYKAADAAYDRETNHGRNQGAEFPKSRGR